MTDHLDDIARRQQMTLTDPVTVLLKAGSDRHGPHEVEVMRMTREMKGGAATEPAVRPDVRD